MASPYGTSRDEVQAFLDQVALVLGLGLGLGFGFGFGLGLG